MAGSDYIAFKGRTRKNRQGISPLPDVKRPRNVPKRFALAVTCKQIYQEFAPLYYGNTKFVIPSSQALKRFLKTIGEQNVKSIRAIIIQNFADETIPYRKLPAPDKNVVARFRRLRDLARKHGLRSVKVWAHFRLTGYRQIASAMSFDVLNLNKPWEQTPVPAQFDTMVSDQMNMWKEALVKLQQADDIVH